MPIQALWRGYIQRKHYQFLKKLSYSSSFFPQLDLFETLSNCPIKNASEHKYTYISGSEYEGEWLGGFRHGKGKATWPDGSNYEGDWNFGYPYGKGTFTHSDGEFFSGKWINPYSTARQQSQDLSERNGYCNFYIVWLSSKPQLYKLRFSTHQRNCEMVYKTMESIKKQIKEKQDSMEETFQNEETFEMSRQEKIDGVDYYGEGEGNERNGIGKAIWGNGDEYHGYWSKNLQNGWGKNSWIDGSVYFGNYVNNMKEGLGEYIWEDGTRYIGEWKNNMKDGKGSYVFSSGGVYQGDWKENERTGKGIFKFISVMYMMVPL